jgi:hypothetical protein
MSSAIGRAVATCMTELCALLAPSRDSARQRLSNLRGIFRTAVVVDLAVGPETDVAVQVERDLPPRGLMRTANRQKAKTLLSLAPMPLPQVEHVGRAARTSQPPGSSDKRPAGRLVVEVARTRQCWYKRAGTGRIAAVTYPG